MPYETRAVMAGLDPAIHRLRKMRSLETMDTRYYGANATRQSAVSILNFRDAPRHHQIETGRFDSYQLHAELAGKFAENRNAGVKIKTVMMQLKPSYRCSSPALTFGASAPNAATKAIFWACLAAMELEGVVLEQI
jgi:hypothetical protein